MNIRIEAWILSLFCVICYFRGSRKIDSECLLRRRGIKEIMIAVNELLTVLFWRYVGDSHCLLISITRSFSMIITSAGMKQLDKACLFYFQTCMWKLTCLKLFTIIEMFNWSFTNNFILKKRGIFQYLH